MSSSQQKRPAARKRPVPVAGAPRPAGAPAPGGSSRANHPPPRPAAGGLLRSIIGGIKREGAAVKAAVADGRAVTKADVETREEKLMRARRDFEKAHGDRMRAELVEGPDDPEASIEFPPMQKVWRNILHELAGELHLHAESVELEDPTAGGDKFVVVYRKPPVVELTEAEEARRAAAAQRARAGAGVKRGEALTDQAPRFAEGDPGPELTVVGTVKRDLRGVAQTIGDMRKRKRDDAGQEEEA